MDQRKKENNMTNGTNEDDGHARRISNATLLISLGKSARLATTYQCCRKWIMTIPSTISAGLEKGNCAARLALSQPWPLDDNPIIDGRTETMLDNFQRVTKRR